MAAALWLAVALALPAVAVAGSGIVWYGLYTDAWSYGPGETVKVYLSGPEQDAAVRLVRLDELWTEVVRTGPVAAGPQETFPGSFLEVPGLSLGGRTAFTVEGWLYPTLLGGDTVVVAGQAGLAQAAAGIVITPEGKLAGYVSDTGSTDPSLLAVADPAAIPLPAGCSAVLDCWYHLALTYDGTTVKLYVNGAAAAERTVSCTGGPPCAVAETGQPFRIGARSEAPGDLTGIADGRFDSWAVWPRALTAAEVEARRQRGLNEDDPAPDPADVDLYLGFEGPYPSTADGSHNGSAATAVNHGTPGVAGVKGRGHAFRLNHDTVVDPGWQVTTQLTIPSGTPSGMYAVQAFAAGSEPGQDGEPVFTRAIAVRPAAGAPRAPIAVVLPTNTWTVYNSWPGGGFGPGAITRRSRLPGAETRRGGENTGYFALGDGVSHTRYHGALRPAFEASPVMPGPEVAGYSVRAPSSMYLTQWLDAHGFAYDVFADEDLDAGLIAASSYRVLMPNSHQEYWSDGMLDTLAAFLDQGGSVVAPAGNVFTFRVAYAPGGIVEMHHTIQKLGVADLYSGIDGKFHQSLRQSSVCNGDTAYHGGPRHLALGVQIHYVHPCGLQYNRLYGGPFCLGQWEAANTGHWLWEGSGLADGDRFGFGRTAVDPDTGAPVPTFAVGHEADTWVAGMPLPGLAVGQQPVILAEGVDLYRYPERVNTLLERVGQPAPSCEEIIQASLSGTDETDGTAEGLVAAPAAAEEKAGTILYFRHAAGGHVLVIGASATPWALASDAALSGLLSRALSCFALGSGCPAPPPRRVHGRSRGRLTSSR